MVSQKPEPSEGTDQPVHQHCLIRIFVVHSVDNQELKTSLDVHEFSALAQFVLHNAYNNWNILFSIFFSLMKMFKRHRVFKLKLRRTGNEYSTPS